MSSPKSTRERLIEAAADAFNTEGFHGTDTNKIARAAGFAPQTFYRHFDDKTDAFVAVYEAWQHDERAALRAAALLPDPDRAIAEAIVDHHCAWRGFRRSLRLLAVENPRVRAARTASRDRQLAALARNPENKGRPKAEVVAALLTVERLSDALAEGELADQGISDAEGLALVIRAVLVARGRSRESEPTRT